MVDEEINPVAGIPLACKARAVWVMNGAESVPAHKNSGSSIAPITIIRMILPRVTTNSAGVTPIAMIPPKGKIPLPGNTKASSNMIGAKTLAAAQISARPAKNGQSSPILSIRPPKRLLAKSATP